MLLLPNGRPSTPQRESLSRDEIVLLTRFEDWLTRRGLKMDLLCEKCMEAGLPPRAWGENRRDANEYKVSCNHAERIYGVPVTEH